jgi:hypothetical protein
MFRLIIMEVKIHLKCSLQDTQDGLGILEMEK